MPSFVKFRNVPDTLLLGSLSMMISHAAASEKPTRAGTVVETAKGGIGYTLARTHLNPCGFIDTNTEQAADASSFHCLAHFSKFIDPGARRIHSDGGPQGIPSIAFSKPDGALALAVVNPTDQPAGLTLDVVGESVACKIPARTIQTYFASFC